MRRDGPHRHACYTIGRRWPGKITATPIVPIAPIDHHTTETMKRKYATAVIFSVAALGFTWVSPYIAMYRISIAAQAVRLENLAQQADLPAVRASVARQLRAAGDTASEDDFKEMLDTIVSPPGITALILHGKQGADGKRHDFGMAYRSWSEVTLQRRGTVPASSQFLLRRHGIWDWKLTDIRLPPELL